MSTQLEPSTSQSIQIESLLHRFTTDEQDLCPDLTRDERMLVQKLRLSVMGISDWPTGRLLRWLHAFDGNAKAAGDALQKHVVFRRAWMLDELRSPSQWDGSPVLPRFAHYRFCGPDREGGPVCISPLGAIDVEGIIKSCQASEYLRYSLMIIERGLQRCEERARQTSRPYERMTMVIDLDGMTSDHVSCKPFAATFLTLIALFQEHYPNLVKKILVINAPSMARYTYQVLIPFLSSSTQQLIEMPADDWLAVVDRYIDMSCWPRAMGGTMEQSESNGDACDNLIPADDNSSTDSSEQGNRVPERYYQDSHAEHTSFANHVTVHAGHKQVIDMYVAEAGSRICWRYATIDEDVGFAVYYDARGSCYDDVNQMEVIYPYIRLECTEVPASGSIMAEFPGRYVIEFDNSYSWFSAKELKYTVEVIEPELTELEQQ